jgi:hypothetical protein
MSRWNNVGKDAIVKLIYEYVCRNKKYMVTTSLPDYRANAQVW